MTSLALHLFNYNFPKRGKQLILGIKYKCENIKATHMTRNGIDSNQKLNQQLKNIKFNNWEIYKVNTYIDFFPIWVTIHSTIQILKLTNKLKLLTWG